VDDLLKANRRFVHLTESHPPRDLLIRPWATRGSIVFVIVWHPVNRGIRKKGRTKGIRSPCASSCRTAINCSPGTCQKRA
jgi:hypothetical protein